MRLGCTGVEDLCLHSPMDQVGISHRTQAECVGHLSSLLRAGGRMVLRGMIQPSSAPGLLAVPGNFSTCHSSAFPVAWCCQELLAAAWC